MSYTQRMSTGKSRRDQFSEATRAALLEAAIHRFATLGFAGTSLEDVAADIRATRGAVYHHFSSKKALFEAAFEKLETEAVQSSRSAGARGKDPWERALLALDAFLQTCSDPVYGRVVWQEAPIALGWAQWEQLENKFAFGLIQEHVRTLTESGLIERLPLDTMSRLAFAMLGAAGQALSAASEADKPRLRDEYRLVIGRMLTGLVATPAERSAEITA
jgi:AcrR family transcriptional regulator